MIIFKDIDIIREYIPIFKYENIIRDIVLIVVPSIVEIKFILLLPKASNVVDSGA